MRFFVVRVIPGLVICALTLISAVAPLRADVMVNFAFAQGTCNVVLNEGQNCMVTFTLINANNTNPAMFLNIVSLTSQTNGDKGDPASVQPGGTNNPCMSPNGVPAPPGGMCMATLTITTDVGGDTDPGSADFNTTTFTAIVRGVNGNVVSNGVKVVFDVVVRDSDQPPPPPPPPPPPAQTALPEPSTISMLATGLVLMAGLGRHLLT